MVSTLTDRGFREGTIICYSRLLGMNRRAAVDVVLIIIHATLQPSHSSVHSTLETSHSVVEVTHSSIETSHPSLDTIHSSVQSSLDTIHASVHLQLSCVDGTNNYTKAWKNSETTVVLF